MSESSSLELAVKLFMDSGRRIQSWATKFVAANGALLVALAALIAWGDPSEDDLQLFNSILMAICFLGALGSVMLGSALFRQQRLSNRLFARIGALQDPQSPLLTGDIKPPQGTLVAALTLAATASMSIAWLALLVLMAHASVIVETNVRA